MSAQYPNSGALFKGEKKNDKAPDFSGYVEVDIALLEELIEASRATGEVKIKLDAWKRVSAKGDPMLSLKVNTWKPQPKATQKDPWDD